MSRRSVSYFHCDSTETCFATTDGGDCAVPGAEHQWVLTASMPIDPPEHIMQFFAYGHLPPHLAEISTWFAGVAQLIVDTLPRNPERTVALRKLLESKDAAVRARLAKL